MKTNNFIFPLQIILNLFSTRYCINIKIIAAIVTLTISQYVGLLLAAYFEHTFIIPGVGKGLLEHYGVWAIVTTDPLLLISTGYTYQLFKESLSTLPVKRTLYSKKIKENAIDKKMMFLLMQDKKSIYIYSFLIIIGFFSWVNNIIQAQNPRFVYGNDVFDAYQYTFGFIANKINLFLSWVIVYPIVAFCSLTMTFSLFMILREMKRKKILFAELHHPDRCFGYTMLGTLNIYLLIPYFLTYIVMFALAMTHEDNYVSLIIPLIILTIIFIAVSYIAIQPLTSFIKRENLKQKRHIQKKLQMVRLNNRRPPIQVIVDSFYLAIVHGSPYSKTTQRIIIALRMITISMTAYKTIFLRVYP